MVLSLHDTWRRYYLSALNKQQDLYCNGKPLKAVAALSIKIKTTINPPLLEEVLLCKYLNIIFFFKKKQPLSLTYFQNPQGKYTVIRKIILFYLNQYFSNEITHFLLAYCTI